MENAYNDLLNILKRHKKIGVAFSGGVDSTLLLHAAQEAVGVANVIAVFCLSTLLSSRQKMNCRNVLSVNFPHDTRYIELELFPLKWREFTENSKLRCYYCKKKIFSSCINALVEHECFVLMDGSHVDDLEKDRPGLRAVQELGVETPLAKAGFTKIDIRSAARLSALVNHGLPSNSCLATRIQENCKIEEKLLRKIEAAENFIEKLGFIGCRVKPRDFSTVVELQVDDLKRFDGPIRDKCKKFFYKIGFESKVLSLCGR